MELNFPVQVRVRVCNKKMGGAASDRNFGLGEELDNLLLLASQQFEEQQSSTLTFPHMRFAVPKSEEEILQMYQNAVPLKTR